MLEYVLCVCRVSYRILREVLGGGGGGLQSSVFDVEGCIVLFSQIIII